MYIQEKQGCNSKVNHHFIVHHSANIQIYICKTQRSVINILFDLIRLS